MVYSTKSLKIPATIGETRCHIETEVVPADVPLLLSKASMKRAGTVLDMEHDRAVMYNKPVKLDFTSSGHYCVNIIDNKSENIKKEDQVLTATEDSIPEERKESQPEDENQYEDEILTNTEEMSSATKQKVLLKLHKQFGHASADRLQKLLKSSGNNDAECIVILLVIVKYAKDTANLRQSLLLAYHWHLSATRL